MSGMGQEGEKAENPIRGWWDRLPPAHRRMLPVLALLIVVLTIWQVPTCLRDQAAAEEAVRGFIAEASAGNVTRVYEQYVASVFLTEAAAAVLLEKNREALVLAIDVEVDCSSSSGEPSTASRGPLMECRGWLIYPDQPGPTFEASLTKQDGDWRIVEFLTVPEAGMR